MNAARDYVAARSKALTNALRLFTSMNKRSTATHPKTAVFVFGAPFFPTFLAKQKSREVDF
jgi:hypothetical protein